MNAAIAALDYAISLLESGLGFGAEKLAKLKALRERLSSAFSAGGEGVALEDECPNYAALSEQDKAEVDTTFGEIQEANAE